MDQKSLDNLVSSFTQQHLGTNKLAGQIAKHSHLGETFGNGTVCPYPQALLLAG